MIWMYCGKCAILKKVMRGYKVEYTGAHNDVRQVTAECPECGNELVARYKVRGFGRRGQSKNC